MLINVRKKAKNNVKAMGLRSDELCQLFYHASSDFNQYLSNMLGTDYTKRGVRAVTIEIDSDKLIHKNGAAVTPEDGKLWCETT